MHAIHRPKFIIKIGELFFQINEFISRQENFISLNLKEKSRRYGFFEEYALKFKIPSKKFRQAALLGWI